MSKSNDLIKSTTAALRPASSVNEEGKVHFPTDGVSVARNNSAGAWKNWGPVYPLVTPSSSGFTWVNQGGATDTTERDTLLLKGTSESSLVHRLFVKSVVAPWTMTGLFLFNGACGKGTNAAGVGFRNSGGNAFTWAQMRAYGGNSSGPVANAPELSIEKWTNLTTFSASYATIPYVWHSLLWMRVLDDNTNRKTLVSTDGLDWTELHSVGRTDFLTANQVVIGLRCNNDATPNLTPAVRILSLEFT